MTEHEAKKILDFLARRAGCLKFDIRKPSKNDKGIIGCICYDDRAYDNICFKVLTVDNMFTGKRITSTDCSYVQCLRQILKYSRDGHVIKIYAWSNIYIFLKANTNLETILVEMDFENVFN